MIPDGYRLTLNLVETAWDEIILPQVVLYPRNSVRFLPMEITDCVLVQWFDGFSLLDMSVIKCIRSTEPIHSSPDCPVLLCVVEKGTESYTGAGGLLCLPVCLWWCRSMCAVVHLQKSEATLGSWFFSIHHES